MRCQHCLFWQRAEPADADVLTDTRRLEIIQEFAELNPRSAVVICGGESMLDATRYFGVSRLCLALGLRCLSVINGTCVANATTADRMIRDGPSEISVSLDDYREEKHDLQRGIKGPFQKAVQAVRLLREVRERHPERPVRIYVMALVHEDNYRELDAFHRFVLCDLRADKLKLNFLQPTSEDAPAMTNFSRATTSAIPTTCSPS
ncbi:MAG: radical SAM protein [Verrucomicrobiae bacterium]|nr:radical SAM protein [Verrucomicrobiae bacterium]